MQRQTQLANELWPLLLPKVTRLLAGIGDGAGGGGVAAHELGGGQHKGVLRDDQAPQFVLRNGLRSITGNLGVEAGITIDGVDISAHASDPDAHHPRAHGIISSDHTVAGNQYQIVGLPSAANTLGLMTPSPTPSAYQVIRTDSVGAVRLIELTVTDDLYCDGVLDFGTNTLYEDETYLRLTGSKALLLGQNIGNTNWTIYNAGGAEFRGNLDVLAGGDLTVAGSGAYAGNPVLFADSSGGNVGILGIPDPQFALDVFGPARAQYFIGPHAIQLKNVLLLAHYDGRNPVESNTTGEPNGHMGQVAAAAGGVVFRHGKFGKAAQVAESTTNLVLNPSFEVDLSNWTTTTTGTGGGFARTAAYVFSGGASARVTATTGGIYTIRSNAVSVANGASVTVQCRLRRGGTVAAALVIRDTTNSVTRATATPALTGEWELLTATWTNTTGGAANIELRVSNSAGDGAARVWVDACQIELKGYATPYCDGSLGGYSSSGLPDGTAHAWTGTAHASTSTRTAAALSYPTAGNLDANAWTIMAWVQVAALTGGNMTVLRATGSTDGFIILRLDSLGRPQAWAGTAAVTATNPITPRTWVHLAATYDGATVRVYVNGVEAASGSSSGFDGMPDSLFVGRSSSAADWLNGWVDDLCILPYAADANLLLSVVESDAPVFAETARYGFRATPKNLVWADDEGLWMRDSQGNPVLGLYGGEAATKSWGGFTLAAGDLVIGYNAVGSSAFRWIKATGKFGFFGAGNSTPQVEIGTDGSLYVGNPSGARVEMKSTQLAGYNSSNQRQWYADAATGKWVVAEGAIVGDGSGLTLNVALAQHRLRFVDNANLLGYIEGFADLDHHLYISVGETSGKGGNLHLSAYNGATILATLTLNSDGVIASGRLSASSGLSVNSDAGGVAGTTTFTDASSAVSSGNGTVKMAAATARNSDAWVKIYIGTTAYWLPAWSNIN